MTVTNEQSDDLQDDSPITPSGTIELTDREKAIALGQDPDATSSDDKDETIPDKDVAEPKEEAVNDDGAQRAGGGKEASSPAWVNEETKSLAQGYGLNDDDMKGFQSLAEFNRAAKFLDRQLMNRGTKEIAGEIPAAASQTDTSEKKVDTQGTAAEKSALDLKEFESAGYDEKTLQIVKHAMDLETRLQENSKQSELAIKAMQEMQWRSSINAFHDQVNSLGTTLKDKRFGVCESIDQSLPKEQDENRRRLFEARETLIAGITARARDAGTDPVIPSQDALLKRAYAVAFGDDIQVEARKSVRQQITEQSKTRRPVAGGRGVIPATAPRKTSQSDFAADVNQHPAVVAAWDRAQEANGR